MKELGQIASLHLHAPESGQPLQQVGQIEVVEAKGIVGDHRYFGRLSRSTGKPTQRQVSLIAREEIAEHASALGLSTIAPGAVRSNIETTGVEWISLLGREVQLGGAVLLVWAPRDPCEKMDAICRGLRERMMNHRQGVLAQVVGSGLIRAGEPIYLRT